MSSSIRELGFALSIRMFDISRTHALVARRNGAKASCRAAGTSSRRLYSSRTLNISTEFELAAL